MGCDCCKMSNYGAEKCTASLKYRLHFCEVEFPGEHRKKGNSNYTKPKKKRRKRK